MQRYVSADLAQAWAGSAFGVALLGLTLVLAALCVFAARAKPRSAGVYLLLGILAVFAANALFPHIAVAVALRAYVPGVATAIALVLPAACWVYISTLHERFATPRGAFMAAAAGVALYAAGVGLALGL